MSSTSSEVVRAEPARAKTLRARRRLPASLALPLLAGLCALTAVIAVGRGAYPMSPQTVVGILLDRAGIHSGIAYAQEESLVLWVIRLPRVVLAGLVGAGLGVSGALLQGIFRNPLADPGVIGVSSGAAAGAVAAIVLGFDAAGPWSLPAAAFLGAMLVTLLVYASSRSNGRTDVVTLILCGIAMSALAGALTGYLTFIADDDELRSITFWALGSLAGASWDAVRIAALPILLGLAAALVLSRKLDVMALGEREAGHLGLHTERVRLAVILLAALMTGTATALVGIVGFVGLVVPHLVRLAVGPGHGALIPLSALGGATLLIAADLVARTAAAPAELPLGVVTALAGAPFFLWLVRRTRTERGGFA